MNRDVKKILGFSSKALAFLAQKELTGKDNRRAGRGASAESGDVFQTVFQESYKPSLDRCGNREWKSLSAAYTGPSEDRYINCQGSGCIYNPGPVHSGIVEALQVQLERQVINCREFPEPISALLSELVSMITPEELQVPLFTNVGTEAVGGALKLACSSTGRPGILAAVASSNGTPDNSLSIAAHYDYQDQHLANIPGYRQIPFGDANILESAIADSFANNCAVAAVILAPIYNKGGVIVPPDDYLARVREICDEYKSLLIIDETETGLGQTGKLFAIEHYEVLPDILCFSKAFGGGIAPIGAFVSTANVWNNLDSNPFRHLPGFEATSLACAAAIAGIQVILDDGLVEQTAEKGNYFLPKLQNIESRFPAILEARGKGLLIGIEFIDEQTCYYAAEKLFEKGILVSIAENNSSAIRIEPPMTISIEELDYIMESLDDISMQLPSY